MVLLSPFCLAPSGDKQCFRLGLKIMFWCCSNPSKEMGRARLRTTSIPQGDVWRHPLQRHPIWLHTYVLKPRLLTLSLTPDSSLKLTLSPFAGFKPDLHSSNSIAGPEKPHCRFTFTFPDSRIKHELVFLQRRPAAALSVARRRARDTRATHEADCFFAVRKQTQPDGIRREDVRGISGGRGRGQEVVMAQVSRVTTTVREGCEIKARDPEARIPEVLERGVYQ